VFPEVAIVGLRQHLQGKMGHYEKSYEFDMKKDATQFTMVKGTRDNFSIENWFTTEFC